MNKSPESLTPYQFNKVPEIALSFWVIKILSTTVGETGADFLALNAGWGLKVTSLITGLLLLLMLSIQLRTRRYTPWIYWLTVVLVSIVGTQITDLLTDEVGLSLYISTALFSLLLVVIFATWYAIEHTLSIREIITRRRELFYWGAILCAFALGTAAGDLATEALSLGYVRGVAVFGMLIVLTWAAWRLGGNAVLTFWISYILTRPFGASLGDLLTQSGANGGLGMGTLSTSALFLCVIVLLVTMAQLDLHKIKDTAVSKDEDKA